jgi:inhibitor of KinA
MKIARLNERVAVAEFFPEISGETLQKVQNLKLSVESNPFPGLQEIWTSYHSVAIAFDPNQITFPELKQQLLRLPVPGTELKSVSNTIIKIPIEYHHNTPDIVALSTSLGLTTREIAKMHSAPTYQVAMLGFQPGFPFLIGLPEPLHHPRKSSPSLRVPKGSVAIGGAQTGIYPSESPGGWYVIGHTPLELFTKPDQFLLQPGDQVQFIAT